VVVMNQGRIEQVGTPEEVYDHPVNPFVCRFLGGVNIFHGRLDRGRMRIGPLEVAVPEHNAAEDAPAMGYVRPHDLVVRRDCCQGDGLAMLVKNIHVVGPLVRVELRRPDTGDSVEAELPKDSYRDLGLTVGEQVYVTPRRLRVYLEPV
jgi:sulfate transport system ATP-binding protein